MIVITHPHHRVFWKGNCLLPRSTWDTSKYKLFFVILDTKLNSKMQKWLLLQFVPPESKCPGLYQLRWSRLWEVMTTPSKGLDLCNVRFWFTAKTIPGQLAPPSVEWQTGVLDLSRIRLARWRHEQSHGREVWSQQRPGHRGGGGP